MSAKGAGQPLNVNKEKGGEKAGSVASNYKGLIGGSVHALGQERTGNVRPGVVSRATWCMCRCTADRLQQGKHNDKIKVDTLLAKLLMNSSLQARQYKLL